MYLILRAIEESLPGRVARVSQRHVADSQLVHGTQRRQRGLDAVAALQTDQTHNLPLLVALQNVCNRGMVMLFGD